MLIMVRRDSEKVCFCEPMLLLLLLRQRQVAPRDKVGGRHFYESPEQLSRSRNVTAIDF